MKGFLAGMGVMLLVLVGAFIWHQADRHAAYAEGQRNERLVWQETQARNLAKADADRKAAQEKITRIETEYWRRSATETVKTAELKKALDNEKTVSGACAAVSRQLRDRLNAIGRRS